MLLLNNYIVITLLLQFMLVEDDDDVIEANSHKNKIQIAVHLALIFPSFNLTTQNHSCPLTYLTVNINGHTSYHDGKYYETCPDCLLSEDTTLLPDRSSKGRYLFLFSKQPAQLKQAKEKLFLSCALFLSLFYLFKHEPARWNRPNWRSSRSRPNVCSSLRSTISQAQVRPHLGLLVHTRSDSTLCCFFHPLLHPSCFRSVPGRQARRCS